MNYSTPNTSDNGIGASRKFPSSLGWPSVPDCVAGRMESPPAYVTCAPATDPVFIKMSKLFAMLAVEHVVSEASATTNAVSTALLLAYDLERNNKSRAAAKQLMRFVELNIKVNELLATNRLLAEMDTAQLSSQALTGVVRATARMKNVLPAWKSTYSRAWSSICQKGKNPRLLFVGMDDPEEQGVAESA